MLFFFWNACLLFPIKFLFTPPSQPKLILQHFAPSVPTKTVFSPTFLLQVSRLLMRATSDLYTIPCFPARHLASKSDEKVAVSHMAAACALSSIWICFPASECRHRVRSASSPNLSNWHQFHLFSSDEAQMRHLHKVQTTKLGQSISNQRFRLKNMLPPFYPSAFSRLWDSYTFLGGLSCY